MTTEKYLGFSAAVTSAVNEYGPIADRCADNLRCALTWTARHMEVEPRSECKVLLQGGYGSAVEAVSLVSFGLVRPAILSLRSYYELTLQFLYYKDHPVEWRNVKSYRSQPNLPGQNKKYLRDNFPKFEKRFKKLETIKCRANEDCYTILSGVAHSTAINSISAATIPRELIENRETVVQVENIFLEVGECVSDIHVASFESNWLSLPDLVQSNLRARLGDKNPSQELDF